MSDPAFQRIRRFSRGVWVLGTIAIIAIALFTLPQLYLDGDRIVDGAFYEGPISPWHQDDPVELAIKDGHVTGDRQGGWIPLRSGSEPLTVRLIEVDDDQYIRIHQTPDAGTVATDSPPHLGSLWDEVDRVHVVPALTDGRLWLRTDAPSWEVAVTPIGATPIRDAEASGAGDAVLSYRGDALSARFTHTGPGFLRVTIVSPGATELAINAVDDVSTRASWDAPGTVLFMIESSAGDWSVAVDE